MSAFALTAVAVALIAAPPVAGAGPHGTAVPCRAPAQVITVSTHNGFTWSDAGIGAAAGVGLSLAVLGGGWAVAGRRRSRRPLAPIEKWGTT